MSRCFGDTFFYLAFLNEGDDAHKDAVEFIGAYDPWIITTEWVLTEVADAMARGGRTRFGDLLAALENDGRTDIVPSSTALFKAGIQMFLSRPDKGWSLRLYLVRRHAGAWAFRRTHG